MLSKLSDEKIKKVNEAKHLKAVRMQFLEEDVFISSKAIERFNACKFHSYMSSTILDALSVEEKMIKTSYFCITKRRCVNPQISCLYCKSFRNVDKEKK